MEGHPTGQGSSQVRAVVGQEPGPAGASTGISARLASASDGEVYPAVSSMTRVGGGHAFPKGLRGRTDDRGEHEHHLTPTQTDPKTPFKRCVSSAAPPFLYPL